MVYIVGLMSLLAAEAGAKQVFAIECSTMAHHTKQIVHDNNYDDIITVIRADFESLRVLPCKTVDIILCDWRGRSPLKDAHFKHILHARDLFLIKDGSGRIFPECLNLNICGVEKEPSEVRKVRCSDE